MKVVKLLKVNGYLLPYKDFLMAFESQGVERKELAIMKILSDSQEPIGARVIAHHLKGLGFELGERAVRYHLKLMDERGLTQLIGRREGRVLTEAGTEEVESALVKDKVGFAISKIETLAFRTSFDFERRSGLIPVNISLFPSEKFARALSVMRPAFEAGLCISDLVAVASEGEQLGEVTVPQGKTGLATVCSIVFNGALLKAGVPVNSRFGGILQLRNHKPIRFVELVDYAGCSLDPSTIFIRARMTSVAEVIKKGDGNILGNFREIPSICRPIADEVVAGLDKAGIHGLVIMGDTSEPVCEIPVDLNKMGVVLLGGLNPVAAAEEAGIEANNLAMSTVMEYRALVKFRDAVIDFRDLLKFREVSK
jgi:repressor of nif and glnA expression